MCKNCEFKCHCCKRYNSYEEMYLCNCDYCVLEIKDAFDLLSHIKYCPITGNKISK